MQLEVQVTATASDDGAELSCCAVHPDLGPTALCASRTLSVEYPPSRPKVDTARYVSVSWNMLVQVGIQNRAGVGGQLRAGQQVDCTKLVCSVFLVKVNLECESHGGNPLASLHWSKDGVETDTGFNVDCSIVLWDSCLYFVVQSYRERERSVNLLPLTLSQVLPHSVLLSVSGPGLVSPQ